MFHKHTITKYNYSKQTAAQLSVQTYLFLAKRNLVYTLNATHKHTRSRAEMSSQEAREKKSASCVSQLEVIFNLTMRLNEPNTVPGIHNTTVLLLSVSPVSQFPVYTQHTQTHTHTMHIAHNDPLVAGWLEYYTLIITTFAV